MGQFSWARGGRRKKTFWNERGGERKGNWPREGGWRTEEGKREHSQGPQGGVLRGQGSSLWCEVAASTWPRHVAALRQAELTLCKKRLSRRKEEKKRWRWSASIVKKKRERSPQLTFSCFLSFFFLSHLPTGTQKSQWPGLVCWHRRLLRL